MSSHFSLLYNPLTHIDSRLAYRFGIGCVCIDICVGLSFELSFVADVISSSMRTAKVYHMMARRLGYVEPPLYMKICWHYHYKDIKYFNTLRRGKTKINKGKRKKGKCFCYQHLLHFLSVETSFYFSPLSFHVSSKGDCFLLVFPWRLRPSHFSMWIKDAIDNHMAIREC